MRDDDELCLCFHVTRRKVQNYIRIHQPRVASQLSECGGAGTGCGWCRAMLRRLLDQSAPNDRAASNGQAGPNGQAGTNSQAAERGAGEPVVGRAEPWPDAAAYAAGRAEHLKNRGKNRRAER